MQEGKPVAYTSRSLSEAEQRYAQIEKEMLAILHACMKFHCQIFVKTVTVFADHKPLQEMKKYLSVCCHASAEDAVMSAGVRSRGGV